VGGVLELLTWPTESQVPQPKNSNITTVSIQNVNEIAHIFTFGKIGRKLT